MKHTQEPWRGTPRSPEEVFHIRGADGYRCAIAYNEANQSRIVACVNACAGIVDPAAELARLRRVEGAAARVLRALEWSNTGDRMTPEEQAYDLRSALEG